MALDVCWSTKGFLGIFAFEGALAVVQKGFRASFVDESRPKYGSDIH